MGRGAGGSIKAYQRALKLLAAPLVTFSVQLQVE